MSIQTLLIKIKILKMKLLALLTLGSVVILNNLVVVVTAKNDVMDANSKKIISWYKGIN